MFQFFRTLCNVFSVSLHGYLTIYSYNVPIFLDYKEGGELYFSDMYVDREQPQSIKDHKELWG